MVTAVNMHVVRNRVPILNDISLTIVAGETIALLGPNGAGKSTLLKCFAGAIRPARGSLRWFHDSSACHPAIRRRIGFSGHEHGLYGELTTLENLIFAARMQRLEQPTKLAEGALTAAALAHLSGKRVALLSQGLRQRVALVRSTIHDPPLILLDEPFASLDGAGRAWLNSLFDLWRHSGRSVCFASHDAPHSREFADRVVSLDRGRIAGVEYMQPRPCLAQRSA